MKQRTDGIRMAAWAISGGYITIRNEFLRRHGRKVQSPFSSYYDHPYRHGRG